MLNKLLMIALCANTVVYAGQEIHTFQPSRAYSDLATPFIDVFKNFSEELMKKNETKTRELYAESFFKIVRSLYVQNIGRALSLLFFFDFDKSDEEKIGTNTSDYARQKDYYKQFLIQKDKIKNYPHSAQELQGYQKTLKEFFLKTSNDLLGLYTEEKDAAIPRMKVLFDFTQALYRPIEDAEEYIKKIIKEKKGTGNKFFGFLRK
ncbi:hypothetical protein [Holospora undulata]|uniref:Uncharacterized protein n=1 Tax=Holospora undulata HU1 TaxID=1321371 RepID=A0A061JIA4_9PROT|nr:hypothetical protein [Holospora undulata]ETZ05357.1 hypothetical protein K737_300209 [Holospora undulata HU1]